MYEQMSNGGESNKRVKTDSGAPAAAKRAEQDDGGAENDYADGEDVDEAVRQ